MAVFNDLINECKHECVKKIKQLKVDTDKTKKIVENSTFIQFLNSKLEKTHTQLFTFYYRHQLMYYHFVSSQAFYKTARDFEK